MKFFSFKAWQSEQLSLIEEESKKYAEEFETIQSFINNDFLDVYYENHGFHDFCIKSIDFRDSHNIIIEIYRNKNNHFWSTKKTYFIQYLNVTEFKINYWNSDKLPSMQIGRDIEWGYDEFSKDTNTLRHSILTSSGKEISISFQNIGIVCA